jgi:hypothetical protein
MKWKSHLAIARALARSMHLSRDLERVLCEGSIEPDRNPELVSRAGRGAAVHSTRMPHHEAEIDVIMGLVWRARRSHLAGDEEDAVWQLGKALHYVQDSCVSTGFLGLAHDSRESEISAWPAQEEALESGLRNARPSPQYVEECLRALAPKKDPGAAMYQACAYSAAIAAAVLSDQVANPAFVQHLYQARRRHSRIVLPAATGVGTMLVAAAWATGNPWLLVPALPVAYLVHRLDLNYFFIRKEARWYDI